MSALDKQVGGGHYKDCAIQPMEYSMANHLDACQHTIIKYVTRFRQKGGIEDLHKAKHTLDMLIEFEEKGQSIPTEMELNFGDIVSLDESTGLDEGLYGVGQMALTPEEEVAAVREKILG